jgi:hypothetical protein
MQAERTIRILSLEVEHIDQDRAPREVAGVLQIRILVSAE